MSAAQAFAQGSSVGPPTCPAAGHMAQRRGLRPAPWPEFRTIPARRLGVRFVERAVEFRVGVGDLHVLVADDQPLTRWAVVQTLSRRRCRLTEARSRTEACGALLGGAFDVVVVASCLNGQDMTDVLRLVAEQGAPRLVILADDDRSRALREAFPDVRIVDRPFDVADLAAAVWPEGERSPES